MPPCLKCNADNDGVTCVTDGFEDRQPGDGDISICIYCGALAVFTDNGTAFRWPTESEREIFLADEDVISLLFAVQMHPRQHPDKEKST